MSSGGWPANSARAASASSSRGSSSISSRRKARYGRDGGGELDGRVLGLRVELAGLLGDALGGDLRAVAADRLVVVLEALQQILDAGMALGVDGDHGAVHDGGERDGLGVGGHVRRVPT